MLAWASLCGNAVAPGATRPIAPPLCWKTSCVCRCGCPSKPSTIAVTRSAGISATKPLFRYCATVSQSYKLYHALKDNGVEVKFVVYPVQGHFPPDPVHPRDLRRRWVDWIAQHFEGTRAATHER